MSEIAVIGTGYVGSVTGACLAEKGNSVTMVDINPKKVEKINAGLSPIEEPELADIIATTVKEGALRATLDLGEAVAGADVILLAVNTPKKTDGHGANMEYFNKAVDGISERLKPGALVVTRSTVPVGTTDEAQRRIASQTSTSFFAVSNPEFLAEGTAVKDTRTPSRIVVGAHHEEAFGVMSELWHPFLLRGDRIIEMDPRSAELTKLMANTLLAGQISIVNKGAEIAEVVGADWRKIQQGIDPDNRIGKFTHAGIGYGGACFPKDVLNLADVGQGAGIDVTLLTDISETNEYMKERFPKKILDYFGEETEGKVVALWGLSFKPNTDDIRESPALTIISRLTEQGIRVVAFDPAAMPNLKEEDGFKENKLLEFAEDKYAAAKGADALVVATEWGTFGSPDLDHLGEIMNRKVVFDGRSIWNLDTMHKAGFYYESTGRPVVGGE